MATRRAGVCESSSASVWASRRRRWRSYCAGSPAATLRSRTMSSSRGDEEVLAEVGGAELDQDPQGLPRAALKQALDVVAVEEWGRMAVEDG
jgi:hypothetical protein